MAEGKNIPDLELEYDEDFTTILESVWGAGFMSPGGTDEVDRILNGLNLTNCNIIDFGCGLGGATVHIAKNYNINHILGIDIEPKVINLSQELVDKNHVSRLVQLKCVDPGPLPVTDQSVDLVFSKDSIIHIHDKEMLAADIYRTLKPGGWFAASDWLIGHDGEPSPEMKEYIIAEALNFGLAGPDTYKQALEKAGFKTIELTSRNEWYRVQARRERDNLSGPLYEELARKTNSALVDHEIDVWDKMIVDLDQGELQPTHLRAQR